MRRVIPFAVFAALFVLSRWLFHAAGVRYFADHGIAMMHFVDLPLLGTRFGETLWYLHGQPPLMSVFLWLVGAFFEFEFHRTIDVLWCCSLVAGLLLGWSWIAVLRLAGRGVITAVSVAVAFSLLPASVVYENYLFYTYPVVALLGLQAAAIAWAARAPTFTRWTLVFLLGATTALYKNVFHLVWMIGLVVILVRLVPRRSRRSLLLAAILPVLLVTSWYGKNLVVHGRFEASSWMGFGLARKTYHQLDPVERLKMAREVDPVIGVHIFGSVDQFAAAVGMPEPTGVPLLDAKKKFEGTNNFHHAIYLDVCDRMTAVAWRMIRDDPVAYLRNVVETWKKCFEPAADWPPVWQTRDQAAPYAGAVDAVLHGNWGARGINFWSVGTALTLLAGGFLLVRYLVRPPPLASRTTVIVTSAFTAAFVLVLGLLFDTNETNRHRFLVDGLVVLVAVLLLARPRSVD